MAGYYVVPFCALTLAVAALAAFRTDTESTRSVGSASLSAPHPSGDQPVDSRVSCDAGPALWCHSGASRRSDCPPCPPGTPDSVKSLRPSRVAAGFKKHALWDKAAEKNKRRAEEAKGKSLVVFVGDSITESLAGTDMGEPGHVQTFKWVRDLPAVFQWAWPTGVALGMGGDETGNLIHRLLEGEMDAVRHRAEAAVLLIGTNNLAIGCDSPEDTAAGVLAAARLLCRGLLPPTASLLVLGLLPRRDCKYSLCWKGVPGCKAPNKDKCLGGDARHCLTPDPLVTWQARVPEVNRVIAAGLREQCPRAVYVDCRDAVTDGQGAVLERMLPDYLHPSREGHAALWKKCIDPALRRLLPPGVIPPLPKNLTDAAALTDQDFVAPRKRKRRSR
eukprot:Hpha_TRINITY_DN27379_c0_g1::TRINITY_DN27379_c0_g1_i1::g.517::m.517